MDPNNPVYQSIVQKISAEMNESSNRRLSWLKEENAKIESILRDLHLLDSSAEDAVDKNPNLHCTFIAHAIALSEAEKQRKENSFISRMKTCSKIFSILNDSVDKDLDLLNSQLDSSKAKMQSMEVMSKEELKIFEVKIKNYEQELLKKQLKYPWLNDEQFDFRNICNEMNELRMLREQRNLLLEELNQYRNLSPDIATARHQLNMAKQEHKQIFLSF